MLKATLSRLLVTAAIGLSIVTVLVGCEERPADWCDSPQCNPSNVKPTKPAPNQKCKTYSDECLDKYYNGKVLLNVLPE